MKKNKNTGVVRVSTHGPVRLITEDMLHQTEFLSLMGATNEQLSVFFQVSLGTIEYWMREYPEFHEARKRGGMMADMKVASNLFARATGYTFKEKRVFRIGRKLEVIEVDVHMPPDVKAQMFWLSSRQREQWTQTQKIAHSGTVKHEHTKVEDLPVTELEPKTQEFLFQIAQKQLANVDRSN